jgi:teichuronic acid biosynthesis glycosyltransferase TuaG
MKTGRSNLQPDFTIIMPAYNAARFIGQSIQSVINQTVESWELIIIDDGSTDVTGDVIEVFSRIDDRIKIYKQVNSGVAKARNVGVTNTTGRYMTFLDADDTWDCDFLEKTRRELKVHKLVCSRYRIMGKNSSYRPRFHSRSRYLSIYEILRNNPIGTLTVAVHSSVFRYHKFDPNFFGTEDWDMWVELAKLEDWHFSNFCAANYRSHSGGISKNALRMYKQEKAVLLKHGVKSNFSYVTLLARFFKRLILG